MGRGSITALIVLGIVGIVGLVRLGTPEPETHRGAGGYVMLRQYVRSHREETGDYPKDARELAEKVGPRMAADGGPKVSYVRDGLVLLQGAGRDVEVEYYYLSADTMPNLNCILE